MSNRYLQDNFAPVGEEHTATGLRVTGELPADLDGRYLRIGPNPLHDPGERYHWFLGAGMVHGVRLRDGRAEWYRNRWVRSAEVAAELGEPTRGAPGPRDFAANTSVLEHAGRTLALVEAGAPPYELTHDLDTVGPYDLGGAGGYTAHPHEDPGTGELHAVSYDWTRGNRVDYSVLDTAGRVRRRVEVEVTGSPMIHDCALTEHYVVIYDLPVTFDVHQAVRELPRTGRLPARLVLNRVIGRNPLPEPLIAQVARRGGGSGGTPTLPYSWNRDYPARIGLLPRDGEGRDVRWFEIDPCYVFHTLNAYETALPGEDPATGEVVLDVVRHDRMFATEHTGPDEGPSRLVRFTLDLASGKVREDSFDQRSQEFPRHDERLTGRRHRYGYAAGLDGAAPGDSVLRHDLVAGTTQARRLGPGAEASEFCFVPRGPDAAEDDGVLMGYVHDRASGLSELRLLDAASLEDVATVHLPARVPAGFHGSWSPTGGS